MSAVPFNVICTAMWLGMHGHPILFPSHVNLLSCLMSSGFGGVRFPLGVSVRPPPPPLRLLTDHRLQSTLQRVGHLCLPSNTHVFLHAGHTYCWSHCSIVCCYGNGAWDWQMRLVYLSLLWWRKCHMRQQPTYSSSDFQLPPMRPPRADVFSRSNIHKTFAHKNSHIYTHN